MIYLKLPAGFGKKILCNSAIAAQLEIGDAIALEVSKIVFAT
jgi:hypothetical protein